MGKSGTRAGLAVCTAAVLAAAGSFSRGDIVAPGATVTPFGTTGGARRELAGDLVAERVTPFSQSTGGSVVSGTLLSRVVREFDDGTLDFYYQVTLDPGSGPVGSLRAGAFAQWVTDVDYRLDGSGQAGFGSASRSVDGNAITFFPTDLVGGSSSRYFFVKTDTTSFSQAGETDLVSRAAEARVTTYGPVPPPVAVPLPKAELSGLLVLGFAPWAARRMCSNRAVK